MKPRLLILILFLLLARSCLAADFDISQINAAESKADEYIRAAISLQAMGRDAACQALLASTKTNAKLDIRFSCFAGCCSSSTAPTIFPLLSGFM